MNRLLSYALCAALFTLVNMDVCGQDLDSKSPDDRTQPLNDQKAPKTIGGGILVGPKTTFVDGPIKNDVIDYFAVLNRYQAEGASRQNNAAAEVFATLGPDHSEFQEDDSSDVFKALGMSLDQIKGPFWIERRKFFEDFPDARSVRELYDLEESLLKPWTAKDSPEHAAWMDANKAAFQRIHQATRRTHWSVPLLPNEDDKTLISAISHVGALRSVARGLAMRSMYHLGQKDFEAAWADIHAGHQLARLQSQHPISLVHMLVAIASDAIACQSERELLQFDLPPQLLAKMQADHRKLKPLPKLSKTLDLGERMMFLDAVMAISQGRSSLAQNPLMKMMMRTTIDWNETLKLGNQYYDRIVAIAKLPYPQRKVEQDKLETKLNNLEQNRPTMLSLAATLLAANVDKRMGKEIGKVLVALLIPAVSAAGKAEQRAHAYDRLSQVGIALAAHRSKTGSYPDSLKSLGIALPTDPFSGESLKYRRSNRGYTLYSVGVNEVDDDGAEPTEEEPLGGDLVLKVTHR